MKALNQNNDKNWVQRLFENRGAALLLTLLCLTFLSVIAMGLAGMSISQSRISLNHFSGIQAYYVAEAGVNRARAELTRNVKWIPTDDFTGTISIEEGTGTYTLKVTPGSSNNSSTYKIWTVESTGTLGGYKRTITAILESESLSRYVMVIDSNPYLWGKSQTPNKYSGPLHTNGYFRFYGKPEFDSPLTSSNQNDSCYNSSKQQYVQGTTTTDDPSMFYRYIYNYTQDQPVGASGTNNFYFNGGQPTKPFPDSVDEQKNNATQVIEGDAVITMLSSGNMEIICDAGNFVYPCDDTTIFVTGNAEVEGDVKGSATIVSKGSIFITDNIVYADKSTDSLALIAEDYVVLKTDPNDVRDIEIDAAISALNESFYVDKYYSGQARGELKLFGSLMQKKQGSTGIFDFSTGKLVRGYSQNFVLDPKFLARPPRNMPVSGKIRVKSWKDAGAFQ
ncbi:MAG: PilX N-terminal domain-containing pilus assembly protein [Firmicutes bacterium]|nr:PilX N-terminal domain-containing pilus assembly protein [Bacillota bacterium]